MKRSDAGEQVLSQVSLSLAEIGSTRALSIQRQKQEQQNPQELAGKWIRKAVPSAPLWSSRIPVWQETSMKDTFNTALDVAELRSLPSQRPGSGYGGVRSSNNL